MSGSGPKAKIIGNRYFRTLAKYIVLLIIIYFAGRHLFSNLSDVSQYDWKFNIYYILISIALYQIVFIINSKAWCVILGSFGYRISLKQGYKINNLANLGRYVPGKFWHVFGMMYMLKKIGINKEMAVASWAISYIYSSLSAVLVGGIAIMLNESRFSIIIEDVLKLHLNLYILISIILASSILFISVPGISIRFYNFIMRKLKKPLIEIKYKMNMVIIIYIYYIFSWIIYGVAFYFLTMGLVPDLKIPLILGIGSMVIAHILGLWAFFAPGGIGIREIALHTMLNPFLGPITAGIVLAARVWSIAIEILAFGIALIIKFEK